MRILPLILPTMLFIFVHATRQTDSPHGDEFKIPCSKCHSPESWELDMDIYSFDHDSTDLPLQGQHTQIDCRLCHTTLVFSEAQTECYQCHTDMHAQTVGNDCGRCHTPGSWIVNNITDIHRQGRFPLLGAHLTTECGGCHQSASNLRFEPLGVECVDCHMAEYLATSAPNHVESNLGTECADCHGINSYSWVGAGFSHQFFPLTQGHNIQDCNRCHTPGDFSGTPTECYACHQDDYLSTSNPVHQGAGFSTDCMLCHTTNPGWSPADFRIHDGQYFPIYSGSHRGEWDSCLQCHEDTNNYASFTCLTCHEHSQSRMDAEHSDINDYSYNSVACLECHPTGSED